MSTLRKDLTWDAGIGGVMTAGNMAANRTSNPIQPSARSFSIQLAWTDVDNPIGTLSFESSNNGGLNWDAIPSSLYSPAITQPNATASSATVLFQDFPISLIRVVYTRTSGGTGDSLTGVLQAVE